MVTRYGKDYRGDFVELNDGGIVMYSDHLEVVNKLQDRIIELIECVHGEFCSTSLEHCECGREIRELKDG